MKSFCLAVFCVLLGLVAADNWAVFVSGNEGWGNYCITSTICRGYELAKRNGIPEDHIIYLSDTGNFNYERNPYPGQIFTTPNETEMSEDYGECINHIDYSTNIDPDLLLNILTGKEDAVKKSHGLEHPKVLKSTEEDNVFVYYMDHGGPGICVVVDDYLEEPQLIAAIQEMHDKHMYKNLVFYFEACYSGSMFVNLPAGLNVYAFTGADADHSALMSSCPPYDIVGGKHLKTCLSAYYDDAWEDFAEWNTTDIKHNDMWKYAHDLVAKSTNQNISRYGDIDTVGELPLSDFILPMKPANAHKPKVNTPLIPLPDVPVHLAKWNAIRADKNSNDEAMQELEKAIMVDLKKEIYVSRLVARAAGEESVEKAMNFEGKGDRSCVNELARQLVRRCGYELPFREEHNKALHYLCNNNSLRSASKMFSDVC